MTLFVLFLFIICTACYTGQSFFNKLYSNEYKGPASAATPVFTIFYGIIVGIIVFFLNGFTINPSPLTIVYGMFNGIVLFLYYLGMIKAGTCGPFSFQSIVMLMGSIVLCIIFNKIVWDVEIKLIQYLGIVLMLLSFIVLNFGGLDLKNIKKGYYFWVFSLFFTNGIFGVLLDLQQKTFPSEKNEMIFITYISCAIFSFIYLLISQKGKIKEAFTMNKKALAFTLLSSFCAGFAVFLLMVLLSYIPSYILYTLNNGTILVLSQILSAIVLKEKMSKQAIIGIILATISIVILNI